MANISDIFVSLSFTAALKVRDCVFSTCVFLLLLAEHDWERELIIVEWNEMNEWRGRWLDSHLGISTPVVNHSRLGANVLPTETSQLWHFLPGQSLCLLSFPTSLLPFSFFLLFLIWCVTGMTHYCFSLWPIAMGKRMCFQIHELSVQLLWFLSPSPSTSSCCFFSYLCFVFWRHCPYLLEATTIFVHWEGLKRFQCPQPASAGVFHQAEFTSILAC